MTSVPKIKYLTTAQIAATFGVTRQRVFQLAASRGIKPLLVSKHFALWEPKQMAALKPYRTWNADLKAKHERARLAKSK